MSVGFGKDTAMSTLKHQYFLARELHPGGERFASSIGEVGAAYRPALRYSSPLPWILALAVSGAIWAGIGLLVWKYV
jgi:hypothetical protein